MRPLHLLFLIAGCGGGELFLERPWGSDQTVVLLVIDDRGEVVGKPAVGTGAKVELEVEVDPPFSVFAWVFTPEVLPPSCPIAVGGEGVPLSRQARVWRAPIEELDQPAAFVEAETPAIDVKTTCIVPSPCPALDVTIRQVDPLIGSAISAIVPLSATRALVTGDQSRRIVEIDGDSTRLLDTTGLGSPIRTLSRQGDTIYGSTHRDVFRFDLFDERIEVRTSTAQRGLEVVPSAAPVIFGKFGLREVFEVQSGTTAIEHSRLDVRHIHMVSSTSGLLVDEMSMVYYFGGDAWMIEAPGNMVFTLESFRRIDGDASSFMAVGRRENAFLRKDGMWDQLPSPFNRGVNFNDVASLGGDRFVAIGDFGTVALYQDFAWCTYELETERSLNRVAPTDDPNVVLLGTDPDPGGVPSLFRIELQ